NKVHFRTLVNEESVESVDCVLPKAVATKVKGRITRNDDGVYLFKFATKSGRDQVIEKGSWMIRKSPIILSKWSPSVSLKRGEVTKVPVWVKLYNGRISFARALIKIDVAVGLKKEVIMAIPDEEGDGYIKEVVRVEYEWKPLHCVDCKSFGHDTLVCPKRVREEVPKNPARDTKTTVMEENDDGFTEVKSRKKNKGANFGGIRLNKPKSKVMWQQKKGMDAKSNSTSPCVSSNTGGNDKGVPDPGLNTSNPFDVLNVDGDDMGESGTQLKASEYVSSALNENRMEASKPSSSKSVYGDGYKDKNDVFTSYGVSLGGGNQLEDEDFDFYQSYADQVVDLDGALKEFRDFKLSMSGRK
nr:hypothetical protein [Tanacetum cinerariifolium]